MVRNGDLIYRDLQSSYRRTRNAQHLLLHRCCTLQLQLYHCCTRLFEHLIDRNAKHKHLCRRFDHFDCQRRRELYMVSGYGTQLHDRSNRYRQPDDHNDIYRYRNNQRMYQYGNNHGYDQSAPDTQCHISDNLPGLFCYTDGVGRNKLHLVACHRTKLHDRIFGHGQSHHYDHLYSHREYRSLYRKYDCNGHGQSAANHYRPPHHDLCRELWYAYRFWSLKLRMVSCNGTECNHRCDRNGQPASYDDVYGERNECQRMCKYNHRYSNRGPASFSECCPGVHLPGSIRYADCHRRNNVHLVASNRTERYYGCNRNCQSNHDNDLHCYRKYRKLFEHHHCYGNCKSAADHQRRPRSVGLSWRTGYADQLRCSDLYMG